MKILFHFLVLVAIASILSACKDDIDDTTLPVPTIDLLFPHHGEVVDSCCITFLWQSSASASDFRFMLSEDKDFTNITLDTTVQGFNYPFPGTLKPGETYFWKIGSTHLQTEAKDSFRTRDRVIHSIDLIFPAQEELVDTCCLTFLWASSASASDFHLSVSEDEDFQTIILDTILDTTYCALPPSLKPDQAYFWKVSSALLQAEDSGTFRTRENIVHSLKLIFPVHQELVDFCCFDFKWESTPIASDYQLLLSADADFTDIVLDTTTEAWHYVNYSSLIPGWKYFWKVRSSHLQDEVVDSFAIKDYLAYYQGTYPVNVVVENWNFQYGVTWDTTFTGSVIIERITAEMVRVQEITTGKGRTYTFNAYLSGESHISFLYNDASRSSIFGFNLIDDTFGGSVIEGGVGLRTIYKFTGMK